MCNVELPILYGSGGNRRARADAALRTLGTGERTYHRPNELSGGHQQGSRSRVLDTRTGEEIMSSFMHLSLEKGITIILVTHEPELADYARRMIHVRDGLLSEEQQQPAMLIQDATPRIWSNQR